MLATAVRTQPRPELKALGTFAGIAFSMIDVAWMAR
jgi:hypothetical protein